MNHQLDNKRVPRGAGHRRGQLTSAGPGDPPPSQPSSPTCLPDLRVSGPAGPANPRAGIAAEMRQHFRGSSTRPDNRRPSGCRPHFGAPGHRSTRRPHVGCPRSTPDPGINQSGRSPPPPPALGLPSQAVRHRFGPVQRPAATAAPPRFSAAWAPFQPSPAIASGVSCA